MLSIIIPAYNAEGLLPGCLASVAASSRRPDQVIVVDDCSTDSTPAVASSLGAIVLRTNQQSGPGLARNLGAEAALGDLLFFLDADCLLHVDTLTKAEESFLADASLAALIGAYDLTPADPAFLSRYRNLMHSFYHHRGRREASTFWGACGMIRREVFWSVGGFSPRFRRPSIEDIELGSRLKRQGKRILLDPHVQIQHRKRWTFSNMLRTDIRDRAIPWTRLILADRDMPNDLNTSHSQRLSVFLTLLSPFLLTFSGLAAAACLATVAILNWRLYAFLARHWNPAAALACIPLHLFYFAYSGLSFAYAVVDYRLRPAE